MKAAVTMLVFCVAALLALGMVMLYSSSMAQAGTRFLLMQLVWCALGLGLCLAATLIDYRWLKKFAWPLFGLAIVLLLLVFVPRIGIKVNGARRWIHWGSIRFQSSELAKLALIIALAWYGEHFQRQMSSWKRGIMIPAAFISVILALVFIEPDRGTTILLGSVSAVLLIIAGVRWTYIVPPVALALAGLGVSLARDPMRARRIFSWLDLEAHKSGVGYQAYQAMIALGAGGWTGLGRRTGTDHNFAGGHWFCRCDCVRHLYCNERARYLWDVAWVGHHVFDRIASDHQHWSRDQRAAEQGLALAVHQLWWVEFTDDAGGSGNFIEHRAACENR
jgi:cell division protein FtsW